MAITGKSSSKKKSGSVASAATTSTVPVPPKTTTLTPGSSTGAPSSASSSSIKIKIQHTKKQSIPGSKSASNNAAVTSPTSAQPATTEPTIKTEEDSDDEPLDPPVEEHFLLRLSIPEDIRERFREQVRSRQISEDLSFTFKDPRHAIFSFEDQKYSARLVDLPCIIESQKTLNNKQLYKIADMSQMLVVDTPITDESQLNNNKGPLKWDDFIWPDGISPPLKSVRKRRFRKRFSNRAIEEIEKEVERLLNQDALAESVSYELIDILDSEVETPGQDDDDLKNEDAEDDEIDALGEEAGAALQRELEMMDVEDDEERTSGSDESDEDEDSSSSDSEEEVQDLIQERKLLEEQIATNESAIQEKVSKLASAQNEIIKKRFVETIDKLTDDIKSKKQQLAEVNRKISAIIPPQSQSDDEEEEVRTM